MEVRTFTKNLKELTLMINSNEWLVYYNTERTHQGKMCCGRTPSETLQDGKQIWQEKLLN